MVSFVYIVIIFKCTGKHQVISMKTEVNLHKNHRLRLRNRFLGEGHLSFEEHNMLELILFYGVPYKDTNLIAHELIAKFGSIENVLTEKSENLVTVTGVGNHTADFLHCLHYTSNILLEKVLTPPAPTPSYKSLDEMGEYLRSLVEKDNNPHTSVVFLNNRFEIVKTEKLLDTSTGIHLIKIDDLISKFIDCRASMAVLFQHKFNALSIPNSEDIFSAVELKNALSDSEMKLLEVFAVTKDGYSPIFAKSKNLIALSKIKMSFLEATDGFEEMRKMLGASSHTVSKQTLPQASPTHGVPESEVLTRLLTFVKRNGANELASDLLARFGSLKNVFYADHARLCECRNINDNIAALIRLVSATLQYISDKTPPTQLYLSDKNTILDFITRLYIGETSECVISLLFEKNQKFIEHRSLSRGGINSAFVSGRGVLESSITEKASYVILTHNHPDGLPVASASDTEISRVLKTSLERAGINFSAHYIIAGGEFGECPI